MLVMVALGNVPVPVMPLLAGTPVPLDGRYPLPVPITKEGAVVVVPIGYEPVPMTTGTLLDDTGWVLPVPNGTVVVVPLG